MNRTTISRWTRRVALTAAMVASSLGYQVASVHAQATTASFTSVIVYQNPTGTAASIAVDFYPELDGTPAASISIPVDVPPYGSGTLAVGSVPGLSAGFKGGAVLSGSEAIIAATIQVPTTNATNRVIATGFQSTDATSDLYLVSYLNGAFSTRSNFAVMNVESSAVDITATFQPAGGGSPTVLTATLPANASKFFDSRIASTIPGLPANFNGSVKVHANFANTANPATIVGTTEEYASNSGRAYGYEAFPLSSGSNVVYLPTAQCYYSPGTQNTLTVYAFQNLSAFTVDATVHWLNTSNVEVGQQTFTNIASGAKASFHPCTASGVPNPNFLGSGYITVSGGGVGAAIGKVQSDFPGPQYLTGYRGQGQGSARLGFPYVRNDSTAVDVATSISIQNIGSDIASGLVTAKFYDLFGVLTRSCTSNAILGQGAKFSLSLAVGVGGIACTGTVPTGIWEGSMIAEGPGGSQLIAVARSQLQSTKFITEDYNGVFLQ